MTQRMAVILGNPDKANSHYCHALPSACAEGAQGAGHGLRVIDVGGLDCPMVCSQQDEESLAGLVEDCAATRAKWLAKMRALGAQGAG